MSFWTQFTSWARKSSSPDWGTLERYLAWAFGGGAASSGIVVNPQTALQSAAVFACVKVLAESIAMLPCTLYKQGAGQQRTPAQDHPLYELLRYQPNDWQSSVEFWEMMVAALCLRGNGYAWINRTRTGDVAELLPLHPDMVNVTMKTGFQLNYQLTMPDGSFKDMGPGDLLHVRGLTLNGWLGISPIAYARESIGLALAAEKFGGQLFRNGAKMSGVLQVPTRMSEEAHKRLKESFDLATSGENAHRTAIIEEGAKYEKIGITPEDSQFLETRKFQRSEIAAIYRVPAHLINDLEKATFSNIEQQGLEFVTLCLMPWLVRIEQAVRRDLIARGERGSYGAAFDVSAMLRGDAAARSAYYHNGILDGWLTRNEARAIESSLGVLLNPIAGLEVPLMPLNMTDGTKMPADEPAPSDNQAPQDEPGAAAVAKMADSMQNMERKLALVHSSPQVNVHSDPAPVTINVTKEIAEEEPRRRVEFLFDENREIVGAEIIREPAHSA
jgi:HK97 family phage portal protein